MSQPNTERSTVRRIPQRGIYNREEIYALLDKQFLCHVAIIHQGKPVVIPTMYGRVGDAIYMHGSSLSRLTNELEKGIDVSVSVASVQGIVLARSAFNHSLNYESVVVFGKGKLVEGEEKLAALKAVSDQVLPGRWEEARLPYDNELKATKVIRIDMDEASAKVRTGDPGDDKRDMDLDIWAGVLPIETSYGKPITDPLLKDGVEMAESVKQVGLKTE